MFFYNFSTQGFYEGGLAYNLKINRLNGIFGIQNRHKNCNVFIHFEICSFSTLSYTHRNRTHPETGCAQLKGLEYFVVQAWNDFSRFCHNSMAAVLRRSNATILQCRAQNHRGNGVQNKSIRSNALLRICYKHQIVTTHPCVLIAFGSKGLLQRM